MRRDGKFLSIDGNIPEGQGIVMAHLNECHELLEMVSSRFCVTSRRIKPSETHRMYKQLKRAMDDGEGEDNQGKVGKKWKNNYKHLIKNIPGASSGVVRVLFETYLYLDRQAYHEEGRLPGDDDASATETTNSDQAI